MESNTTIKRENLIDLHYQLENKIKNLESKTYHYTINTPCLQFGKIAGMTLISIKTVYGIIKEIMSVNNDAASELGIELNLFPEEEQEEYNKFEGHSQEEWIINLKTRIDEIQDVYRLENYKKALLIIDKWLSDDDKFAIDMNFINDLFKNL